MYRYIFLKSFQLSHDFSAMETPIREILEFQHGCVSIEPRLFSHGDGSTLDFIEYFLFVSIEPRLFSHGDWIVEPAIPTIQQ